MSKIQNCINYLCFRMIINTGKAIIGKEKEQNERSNECRSVVLFQRN